MEKQPWIEMMVIIIEIPFHNPCGLWKYYDLRKISSASTRFHSTYDSWLVWSALVALFSNKTSNALTCLHKIYPAQSLWTKRRNCLLLQRTKVKKHVSSRHKAEYPISIWWKQILFQEHVLASAFPTLTILVVALLNAQTVVDWCSQEEQADGWKSSWQWIKIDASKADFLSHSSNLMTSSFQVLQVKASSRSDTDVFGPHQLSALTIDLMVISCNKPSSSLLWVAFQLVVKDEERLWLTQQYCPRNNSSDLCYELHGHSERVVELRSPLLPLEAYLGLSSAICNLNMPFAQEKVEERISSQVVSMSKQAQPNTDWLGVMQDKWSMTGV